MEYQLHERSHNGEGVYLLTVTDRNTIGLRGPVLSFADIQGRGNILRRDENWAAFEGMGYTKEDETSLGTRGQGKAAFLYHSRLPRLSSTGQDRMIMLYDTLLASGEYRLGVRYANPSDTVLEEPFRGDDARHVVSTSYALGEGEEIRLGLEPLSHVGARIIVPHLSEEAVSAIRSGELHRWLQRCWWRAVQVGLTIDLVDEHGDRRSVPVPAWWANEPWRSQTSGVRVHENIDIGNGLKIKRIVLLYDESLDEPDIEGVEPQFHGVQLLRGQQWIETLAVSDYIPRDKRPGFRGFVEFDRSMERMLRSAEKPQHENFDRRFSGVKEAIAVIEGKVKEFAEDHGWTNREVTRPVSGREQDAAIEFLRFLSPSARARVGGNSDHASSLQSRPTERWECDLLLEFPDSASTRVNWGESIRNVKVAARLEPPTSNTAAVSLELAKPDDPASRVVLATQNAVVRQGEAIVAFGDFQVITGASRRGQMQCAQSGKWRLTARVQSGGVQVARASRALFVNEDPPAPPTSKPYALSIAVENHTTQQRRINSGDAVGVLVSVTNRTPMAQTLELTASLGDLLLADKQQVRTRGTPAGATPARAAGVQTSIIVNPSGVVTNPFQPISLPPGRHPLRADLLLAGEVVAHASRTLDVEVDPPQIQDWPPFRIEQITGDGPYPRWQFNKSAPDDWGLLYPPTHPLCRALESSSGGRHRLLGIPAFVVDICAEAIIEWAMDPVVNGDESRMDELLDGIPTGASLDRWEEYREKMRELVRLRREPERTDEYGHLARDCAARSLNLFEERE